MSRLTIAIPSKGRLKDNAEAWLGRAGFKLRQSGGDVWMSPVEVTVEPPCQGVSVVRLAGTGREHDAGMAAARRALSSSSKASAASTPKCLPTQPIVPASATSSVAGVLSAQLRRR